MKYISAVTLGFFLVLTNALAESEVDSVFDDGFEDRCSIYYSDADEDGFGDPQSAFETCVSPAPEFVFNGGDCDDSNKLINPGIEEITLWAPGLAM